MMLGQESHVLSIFELQMRPAHLDGLQAKQKACEKETCYHLIQLKDISKGHLGELLILTGYAFLDSEDPTKAEVTRGLQHDLDFPTAATLKDLAEAEGDFDGK